MREIQNLGMFSGTYASFASAWRRTVRSGSTKTTARAPSNAALVQFASELKSMNTMLSLMTFMVFLYLLSTQRPRMYRNSLSPTYRAVSIPSFAWSPVL